MQSIRRAVACINRTPLHMHSLCLLMLTQACEIYIFHMLCMMWTPAQTEAGLT